MSTVRLVPDEHAVDVHDLDSASWAHIIANAVEGYRDAEPGPESVLRKAHLFEVVRAFRCVRARHLNEGAGT